MMKKGACSAVFFITFLSHIPKSREARVFFRAGINRDGYFDNNDLLRQTDRVIDIFESKTKGFVTGLWLFDNAPGHQKWPANGLSARKMPKNPHKSWTHVKNGPAMCSTTFTVFHPPLLYPETIHQHLYYPDDHPTMPNWFKGMANILKEQGLYPPAGLIAQCEGFRCVTGATFAAAAVLFSHNQTSPTRNQLLRNSLGL